MGQKTCAGITWCAYDGCNKPMLTEAGVARKHKELMYCLEHYQIVREDINGETVLGEP